MASSLDTVLDQMQAAALPALPERIVANSGRFERFPEKGPQRGRGWYRINEYQGRSGRTFYAGAFGWWGLVDKVVIEPDLDDVDDAERERLREQVKAAAEREVVRRQRRMQSAANRARDTWREATIGGQSPYLARKQVAEIAATGWVRFLGEDLVVPMCRYDLPAGERLKGVQIIAPDGAKRFTPGMEKTGAAAALGHHQVRAPILICEGLATAASCWLALQRRLRVVVAFDAGSLLPVGQVIRALHPDARLLYCADDDYLTDGNPGRIKARDAALEIGRAGVVFPVFRDRGDRKLTDFNDLHCTEGLAEVTAQLEGALKWLPKL